MNVVYQGLGLLLLVTGALSATIANLGETCAVGDTCSVNGAVCDKNALTCVCQFGYVQSGTLCSRRHMGLCGAGMCGNWNKMICDATASQCKCDTTKGYIASGSSCVCPTNQQFNTGANKCQKAIGQSCAADSDCYTTTGMVCSSGSCACNTALNLAGSSGAYSCACATGYSLDSSSVCKKVNDQACTAGECISPMVCDGTSNKCKCPTTSNYAAGSAGDTACTCATGFADSSGTCKKKHDQPCAAGDCLPVFICDGTSNKCTCDTALHYAAGTAGDTTCTCATGYSTYSGTCKKVHDQPCSAGECAPNMLCDGTSNKCTCDTSLHYAAGTAADLTCTCNAVTFFGAKTGGGCIGLVGAACSADSDCKTSVGMKCSSSVCACDTALGYAAGSNGAATCSCASGSQYDSTLGKCGKAIGQACSATSDCYTGLMCTSSACACDATAHKAGTSGTYSCSCASGYANSAGTCYKVIGQSCSAESECYPGLKCTSGSCACDADKHYTAPGTTGQSSCTCASGYTYSSYFAKCAVNLDQTCTRDAGSFIPCVDNAVCDFETDTCKCDAGSGYQASGSTCVCKTGYTSSSGRCLANLDTFCIPSTQAGVCVGGATCFAGNATTVPQCLCDSNKYDYKFSCSGGSTVVASIASLLTALFMTARLM